MKQLTAKILLPAVSIIVVCSFVIAAHWPALSAKAVGFDDEEYVTRNPLTLNPSWDSAKRFLFEVLAPSTVKGYYQPLTMISLMLDSALGGSENNLAVFHRTSLLLHAANVALIIILLYMLFGSIVIAALVGLLFGLHPMTVEIIPWLGERKTLLAAFFSFASLIYYVRFARSNNKISFAACILMYLLALMSKPTSLPLPAVMLLMDFWPLNRFTRKAVLEKIPFFALAAVFAVIFIISQSSTAGTSLPGQYEHKFINVPLIISYDIIFYPVKILWPVNLTAHYAYPQPFNFSNPLLLACILASIALIFLLVLSLRWIKAPLTGWLIFFIAMLPTMQILRFSDVIASDKFAYLPAIGLLMILTAFLSWLQKKRSLPIAVIISLLLIAGAETLATRKYLTCWRDSTTLYKHMISLAPNSAPLYGNLGIVYGRLGKYDESIDALNMVAKLRPGDPGAYYNLGVTYLKLGRDEQAIEAFKKTLDVAPDYPQAWCNLGYTYGLLRRYDDEIYASKKAIEFKPDYFDAWLNLGHGYGNSGQFLKAVDAYAKTVEISPNDPRARFSLGFVLFKAGEKDVALQQYEILKSIDPNSAEKLKKIISQ